MEGMSAAPTTVIQGLESRLATETVVVPVTGCNLALSKVRRALDLVDST